MFALLLLAACSNTDGILYVNAPPAVTITEPAEQAVFPEGETIVFRGLVADDSGAENLELQWSSSIDGELFSGDIPDLDGRVEMAIASLALGTHVVTLRAFDLDEHASDARVTITIEAVPDHPTLVIEHPQPTEQGLEDFPFEFAVTVDDHQDLPEELLVELSGSTQGHLCWMVPDSNGFATCSLALPLGQHLLTFKVTDTDGFSTSRNHVFEMVARGDYDADFDGWTPNEGDCVDTDGLIFPGAAERCNNIDDDCNPNTAIDVGTSCYDDDTDGHCETPPCVNTSSTQIDCDDGNAGIGPTTPEIPNGRDDDCDGTIDEGTNKYDDDGDGYCESPPCVNAGGTASDCNDGNPNVNPGRTEQCGGVDDNCNGLTNEQNATGCTTFYRDNDGDGYGIPGASQCWCDDGAGLYTGTTTNDCYDSNPNAYPGQPQWFADHRGDGSFDYNCTTSVERYYTNTAATCRFSNFSCSGSDGWNGTAPACGQSKEYIDDCEFDIATLLFSGVLSCGPCWDYFLYGASASGCLSCISTNLPGALACDPDAGSRTQVCH